MKFPFLGRALIGTLLLAFSAATWPDLLCAAVTPEHRKQVADIRRNLTKVSGLIGRREWDDAERLLKSSEEQVQQIIREAEIDEKHALVAQLLKQMLLARAALAKKQPGGELKPAGPRTDTSPVQISKPTGGERVSFTQDIAPFIVNLCVNCHSGNGEGTRQTGLALDTFEKLLRGGKGGEVIVPGKPQESRLWQLVGEQNPIKMPPGQALITRTNWNNLRMWIEEGAKFDGTVAQARAPLRNLVPSSEERRAKELAALSPDEQVEHRRERGAALWRTAFSKISPAEHASDNVLLLGNVAESRLKDIGQWCDDDVRLLKKMFGYRDDPLWRGKLSVFVFKDRFSYAEFVQTNEKVELPADVQGHSRVSVDQDDAYACLQDPGEVLLEDSLGARALVLELLTEAMFQRSGKKVPEWAARGLGLTLAARQDPKNAYFRRLPGAAHEIVKSVTRPQDLFAEGALPRADVTPIGFTLVGHMLKVGGEPKFVQFLKQLASGKPLADALKEVYSADTATLGRSYVDSLGSARPAVKKNTGPK